MRRFGILVLLAGIALTQCYLDPPSSFSRIASLLRAPTATPITSHARVANENVFTKEQAQRQTGPAYKDAVSLSRDVVVSAWDDASLFLPARAALNNYANATWSGGAGLLPPKEPLARYNLVIKMQSKLKSLGCYWGRVDGSWGVGSKAAMQAYLDRVNAKMSTDQPNAILLALLQSNGFITCGGCSNGKTRTPGGDCVHPANKPDRNPRDAPLIASATSSMQDNAGQVSMDSPSSKYEESFVEPSSLQGRLSLGGPQPLPQLTDRGEEPSSYERDLVSRHTSKPAQISMERKRTKQAKSQRSKVLKQARRSDPIRNNLLLSLGGFY